MARTYDGNIKYLRLKIYLIELFIGEAFPLFVFAFITFNSSAT